ncbi:MULTISPECIES: hypothetical protein [unclassified Spirillospora]|uniref:hypothetical protein n=1 Tax=unclassified Spirillospora TaxID=2642701 RepID=UPI003715D27D
MRFAAARIRGVVEQCVCHGAYAFVRGTRHVDGGGRQRMQQENAGLGSAIFSSVQQVGGAVGVAVLVTVAARRSDALTDSLGPLRAATEGFSLALTVAAALLVLGAVLIAGLLGRDRSESAVQRP